MVDPRLGLDDRWDGPDAGVADDLTRFVVDLANRIPDFPFDHVLDPWPP